MGQGGGVLDKPLLARCHGAQIDGLFYLCLSS